MKYSKNFERDFNWYLKYKDVFTFDGTPKREIQFSENGKTAKECFYIFDSTGKILPTSQPELLQQIFKCKGAINFNIKMWAESRAAGDLPKILFLKACKEEQQSLFLRLNLLFGDDYLTIEEEFELLPWMTEAVERQKFNYTPYRKAA